MKKIHKYNFVKQTGIKECGISCMSMIIKHYGGFINHSRLIEMTHTNKLGTTAFDIVTAFRNLGFNSYGVKYYLGKDAATVVLPAIAHTIIDNSYNHFVLIYEINYNKEYLIIADPADKIKKISFKEFNQIFTNNIIIAYPNRVIEKEKNIKTSYYLKKFIKTKSVIHITILILLIYAFSITYMLLLKNMIKNQIILCSVYIPFVLILKHILNIIKNKYILNLKNNTSYSLMEESFNDLLKLPYSYYRNHTTGEVINRLNDIDNIKDVIDVITFIISNFIIMSATGLILFLINKILFTIMIFIMFFYLINYLTKYKKINILLQNLKQSNSILNSFETEAIVGFESIKGQNLENCFKDKFKDKVNNYLINQKKYQNLVDRINVINSFISDLSLYLIITVGLILIKKSIITYSDLLVFYALSNYFIEPIFSISNLSLIVSDIKLSFNRLIELKYSIKNKCKKQIGDIKIKNLSFKYDDNLVLSDLNLNISRGEKIALIGSSGCGKSTLLKILKQYYKASNIKIDNTDINKINLKDNISYISQDEYLFTDTIYNNIVMDKKIDEDELNKIIDICSIDKIINKNNLRLNTLIEENGFNLSGGEIERIVLARALVNIKDYLFIDEGLSEVDINLERIILKKLLKEYSDKTIIFTTHRMDNIDLFDRVVNLDSMN